MWATLALTTVLNLAPDAGTIKFENVRPTYGPLGQNRKEDEAILPGDVYFLTFEIEGLTVGKDDLIKYAMSLELLDSKNKQLFKKDEETVETINALGGNRVPALANVTIGFDTLPGEYTVVITVKDSATKKTEKLPRKFEVKKLEFGAVGLGYSYSPVFRVPVPPMGVIGQTYHVMFDLVGWEVAEKTRMPEVTAEALITDADGKPTRSEPMSYKVDNLKEEALKTKFIPMSFPISLNRPGKYKVTITVADKVAKPSKTKTYSLDLEVVTPK